MYEYELRAIEHGPVYEWRFDDGQVISLCGDCAYDQIHNAHDHAVRIGESDNVCAGELSW